MINWKQCAKRYRYYKRCYDYEQDFIGPVVKQLENEDKTGKFNTKEIRDLLASYCKFMHGDDEWIPTWKNNYRYRKMTDEIKKRIKRINDILWRDKRKQTAINIAFPIMALYFIYDSITRFWIVK